MSEIEELRRKQTRLKNEAIEAEARPGRKMSLIRAETLAYYQSLEPLLMDALDLADKGFEAAQREREPVIQFDAEEIECAVRKVLEQMMEGKLTTVTTVNVKDPSDEELQVLLAAVEDGKKKKRRSPGMGESHRRVLEPLPPAEERPGWMTVTELCEKYELTASQRVSVYELIKKGRFILKGDGRQKLVWEASYLEWRNEKEKN